ncbi:glycosyltransferase family 25 protein [Burkholderia dolosa]|uniref:glycosyltransferase family 25 protein n=1 Tax=Burkholderia dolosa TaxID=152500 RepID=UPI001590385D|nr:glycosyltransferase family 25 protein [Burkholderia dolosa]MBY4753325.1 glycosyltransferase family 25 protein [Burkholderia dolosa]
MSDIRVSAWSRAEGRQVHSSILRPRHRSPTGAETSAWPYTKKRRGKNVQYVCISLKKSTDRRQNMTAQFANHGIDGRFFDAIESEGDGQSVHHYNARARTFLYGKPLTRGEIGCYLSHREVWKQLLSSGDDAWCVMEDDIVLLPGFTAATRELAACREHWDIVRLYGIFKNPQIEYAALPSGTRLMWMDVHPLGTQCYVITRAAAQRMLAHSEKIMHPIDDTIDQNWKHKLRLYITSPEFVADGNFASTIGPLAGRQSLGYRLCVKPFRKLRKLPRTFFNWRNRPACPIRVELLASRADSLRSVEPISGR